MLSIPETPIYLRRAIIIKLLHQYHLAYWKKTISLLLILFIINESRLVFVNGFNLGGKKKTDFVEL